MLVIPAIDLRGGQCVRLTQGRLDKETIFSKDPVFIAKLFKAKGAKRLHIVDLDGAFSGKPQNKSIIKKIVKSVDIPVQLGGGIREFKTIKKILSRGIDKVIIGTAAIYDPNLARRAIHEFGRRVIVGIDAFNGKVAIGGWKEITSIDAIELAKKLELWGVSEIIFTDISKDGMLEGPNLRAIKKMAKSVNIPIIASGGISSLRDIERIKRLERYGVIGVIIGKAIYTESISLEDAIQLASE